MQNDARTACRPSKLAWKDAAVMRLEPTEPGRIFFASLKPVTRRLHHNPGPGPRGTAGVRLLPPAASRSRTATWYWFTRTSNTSRAKKSAVAGTQKVRRTMTCVMDAFIYPREPRRQPGSPKCAAPPTLAAPELGTRQALRTSTAPARGGDRPPLTSFRKLDVARTAQCEASLARSSAAKSPAAPPFSPFSAVHRSTG